MKALIRLLFVLFSGFSGAFCFGQADTTKPVYDVLEKYVLEIYKPSHIDISSHRTRYGILGPESFTTYVKVRVVKTIFNNETEPEITIEMNDTDVNQLNSCRDKTLFVEIKQSVNNPFYRLSKFLSKSEFERQHNIRFPAENSQQKIMFTVKSKTVSIPIHTVSSILFNDTIHEEQQITYEVLELADSMAIATYGSTIKVLESEYHFDNSAPFYLVSAIVSPLFENYISDETIYEVISVVPLKK